MTEAAAVVSAATGAGGVPSDAIAVFARGLALGVPEGLVEVWSSPPEREVADLLYRPTTNPVEPPSVMWALATMRRGAQRPSRELVPLFAVDDRSFACVVCAKANHPVPDDFGMVVRWHLDDVPARGQRQLLDTDPVACVAALVREERFRAAGKEKLISIADEFYETHGKSGKLPRAHVLRPLRLATQNVVIGEAVFAYDASFDGLAVHVWQTAQEPHVNVHEGTRGLLALTLAEAFKSGGTMEVRFDQHPERAVPGALAQWARTQGIDVDESAPAITPAMSRELLLAAMEMPAELRERVEGLAEHGGFGLERACYTLVSGIWRPVELDFLLAVTPRAPDILLGGTDPLNRPARQAEMEVCRAAAMLGTLHQRLQQMAPGGDASSARVVEDERQPLNWQVLPEYGAVRFDGLPSGPLPWASDVSVPDHGSLTVFPRSRLDAGTLPDTTATDADADAILLPADAEPPSPSSRVSAVMRFPDRLATIDRGVDVRLLACQVGRR